MSLLVIEDVRLLDKCCRTLASLPWIGIDTEFLRVRTYYPRCCLLQISSDDGVVGIDPLRCESLEPLQELLRGSKQIKIIHAARQDLEVLYHICGQVPQPVFDTQIAAAMLGFGRQVSYAALVETLVGRTLSKQETRTNWCLRPLTAGQLEYAYEDVSYLGALYDELQSQLRSRDRREWLEEECRRLLDPELYAMNPEQAYRRLRRGHVLEPPSQQILKRLARWRERTAQSKDLPRNWIVDDKQLLAIAAARPLDRTQLSRVKGLSARFLDRHADAVLSVVGESLRSGREGVVWRPRARLGERQQRTVEWLARRINETAKAQQISASLIATKKEMRQFVRDPQGQPLVQGWRYQLVGRDLIAELETDREQRERV